MQQQEKITRWYKEPFMLLILGIPLTAVVVGGVLLYNALSTKDSLISDSYYKDGMVYTQNKTAINLAKSLLVGAQIQSNDAAGISLSISGNLASQPSVLKAKFIHPTLDTLDQEVLLQAFPDGTYKGAPEADLEGRWRIWLSSPEQGWMLQANVNFLDPDTFQFGIPAHVSQRSQATNSQTTDSTTTKAGNNSVK